ncbi:class-II fumarase/aspartase family protein [Paracoccus aestuariivivens]|uniref:Adenylosuccinate lyase family protein n=1 Tax=Paracoccus aestuariivivens TaxID=1820333 RepID=A0A6L6J4X0_9RHOB|nr:adenylosuccinate lyase family protein [Paracoccus aestuariivivens]MTH77143.1 adenylosuccinate lyase family protein [Paracoccus aestuariivivens]
MPASAADSAIYRHLFSDEATAALFTDSAEIRAMLLVEGTLARVQGQIGLIPQTAAAYIDRASREAQIDPAGLGPETAINGVPVPALVSAFRKAMQAPEYAQYLHWGATSQDIMETGLALRLRRVTEIWDERLGQLISALGQLADTYATVPMAARTYGQVATPTSFGAVIAGWGHPLIRHRQRLGALRPELATVSLGGAAGTLSAMGAEGPEVRAALATELGLTDPGHSWHAERDQIGAFAAWMAGVATSLAKIGEDLILMTQSGIGEIRLEGAGGSSTMPQKQNPVGPSVLVAIGRQAVALASAMQGAGIHRQQRDGSAWFVEWLTLPQLCISTGRSIAFALELVGRIAPDIDAMARGLDDGTGLIHAEAFTFALARHMPRPEAQTRIKNLCREAQDSAVSLQDLVARDFPELDLSAAGGLGIAPAEARAFAKAAQG